MDDDNKTSASIDRETTSILTEPLTLKKQRAPRRSKAEIAADTAAKSPKVASARATKVKTARTVADQSVAKPAASSRSKSTTNAVVPVATSRFSLDEMADLVKLEEENKELRSALTEKLRAENADLRKRLSA